MNTFKIIVNFFDTGSLLQVIGVYGIIVLLSFFLIYVGTRKGNINYGIEVLVNILLVVTMVIGAFVFNKYFIFRALVGSLMVIISMFCFFKLDKILLAMRK